MLAISEKQQVLLDVSLLQSYIKELSLRLIQRDPELVKTIEPDTLKQAVTEAVVAAQSYGFTQKGTIRLYLDLCVAFGSGFVDDPVCSWAIDAIGDNDINTQVDRSEALFQASLATAEAIWGPNNEYSENALHKIQAWALDPIDLPATDLKAYCIDLLQSLYPEKAEYAGTKALELLFDDAIVNCDAYGLENSQAIFISTVLKFSFGNDCFNDPFYAWIGSTLTKENELDIALRFERLQSKVIIWLDAVLANQNG